MAKTKEKAPKPTRAELDQWYAWEQKRLDLARQAKNLAAEQKPIAEKALAYAQSQAGKQRPALVSCCDFGLELKEDRENVKWKDHYIELAGHEKAAELTAAAKRYDAIKIHAPAKA